MTQTLVTGGSGFIGQHLVAALLAQGRKVRVLDVRLPTHAGTDVQYVKGTILDPALVHEALAGVTEVYHLAALPGMWTRCKNDFHAINCRGTEIVLEAASQRGVARFLHCSTESILFGSSSPGSFGVYTRSKLAAEQRALRAAASGFPVVIANPTMPIGPYNGNGSLTPPTLMLRYFMNRRIQLYFDFTVNLVDVRDVAAGLVLTMERGQSGHRYILGGESILLAKVLADLGAVTGRKALRVPIPAEIAQIAAAAVEFLSDHVTRRPPAGTLEGVRIAIRSRSLSFEKSRCELGYVPSPIGPALRETVALLLRKPDQWASGCRLG
jgi:nucleoside-diphosphate-sugar epimerase